MVRGRPCIAQRFQQRQERGLVLASRSGTLWGPLAAAASASAAADRTCRTRLLLLLLCCCVTGRCISSSCLLVLRPLQSCWLAVASVQHTQPLQRYLKTAAAGASILRAGHALQWTSIWSK